MQPLADLASILTAVPAVPVQPRVTAPDTSALQEELLSARKRSDHVTELLREAEASVERLSEQARVRADLQCS